MRTTVINYEVQMIAKHIKSAEGWMAQDAHRRALAHLEALQYHLEEAIKKIEEDRSAVVA